MRFLLGLPNSRLDAYAGKYCSRGAVFVGSLLFGLAVFGVVAGALLQEPSPAGFLLFVGATVVYGLVFLGVGLALSALLDSETSVTAGIISAYVLFRGGWMVLQWLGLRVTRGPGETAARPFPEWYYFLGRANPMNADAKLLDTLFNEGPQFPLLTTPLPEADSVATGDADAVAALLAWLVVVPVVGYLGFKNKDVL